MGVPDAIARHAYLFELHSCFNGIPSIDPFPPSQHRSGYEKRQHPDGREVGGQEVASGEEREGVRNQFLGMVGQMFESLDPRYNNQVGLFSSIKIVGLINSNAITKKAMVNKYNTTHKIACGLKYYSFDFFEQLK